MGDIGREIRRIILVPLEEPGYEPLAEPGYDPLAEPEEAPVPELVPA